MRTVQLDVDVTADHHLSIDLPEDIKAGRYQVVLVLNPCEEKSKSFQAEALTAFAGQVKGFAGVNAVDWQRKIREEWDESGLSD